MDGARAILDGNQRSNLLADFQWGAGVNSGQANNFHPHQLVQSHEGHGEVRGPSPQTEALHQSWGAQDSLKTHDAPQCTCCHSRAQELANHV